MSTSRLLIAIALVFIASVLLGTLTHAVLLQSDYAKLGGIFRAGSETQLSLLWAGDLAFSIGSVWLYSHAVEDKPWAGQGARFGVAMWLVTSVPAFLITYAMQPLPESLVVKQLAYELVDKVILGMLAALIVRRV